jgi:hypothetical protein
MNQDGLDQAMAEVADDLDLTIQRSTGAAPGEGTVQVLIRATAESRDRWKRTAGLLGISMAEMIRQLADAKATELLDCTHPRDGWRTNRYGSYCGRCGQEMTRRR